MARKKPVIKAKEINLHPRQFEAFNFQTQFCLAVAGVRGGKTFVGAVWAGDKIANMQGDGLITAPDFQTLRDATLHTFFTIFPEYRKYYKEHKHVIELPGGKRVFLRSMDDPLSAEGLTVSWVWADEAGKYKILAWHSIRSRVSLKKGPVFLTTTPYNMGWLYTDFYQPWQKKEDDDFTVVDWASVDNPYFPPEVFESEKKRLSSQEFNRRYRGRFARSQGLVYNLPMHSVIDPRDIRADITIGGIDWGWAHHAALVVVKFSQGVYTIIDEWYETEKTTPQIIEQAMRLQNLHGVNRWYADSANPEKIAEARGNTGLNVIPYEKKKDSISAGVNYINNLMLENRFFIFRGLKYTLEEFDLYSYPEPNKSGIILRDEPVAMNNDLMDCMRYAIMGYQPAKRFKTPQPEESYTQLNIRRLITPQGYGPSPGAGGDDFV